MCRSTAAGRYRLVANAAACGAAGPHAGYSLTAKSNTAETRGRQRRVGGGALGFAHIGVIDYLEQHHIPIDLVVGTSMGGLVGGLYTSGRSPDEIRTLVKDINAHRKWWSGLGRVF